MLRRKVMLVVGLVVTLLLATGVVAVMLLQSVLTDLDHISTEALTGTSAYAELQLRVAGVKVELERARSSHDRLDIAAVAASLSAMGEQVDHLGQLDLSTEEGAGVINRIGALRGLLAADIQNIAAAPDPSDPAKIDAALETVSAARQQIDGLQETIRLHTERQQRAATARFRWMALGLGLAFVIVLNISIMVLARLAGMILKPVDRLVEASRRLAREEFDVRVDLDRRDEFGELARAFNSLATQLQANEQRKVETMHQVARTLNHELNNAIAIIQLQLDLVARTAGSDGAQTMRLREIQQTLARMTGIVASLTRVRRIVLTDYLNGVKMLDLQASVADEPDASGSAAQPPVPVTAAHAVQQPICEPKVPVG